MTNPIEFTSGNYIDSRDAIKRLADLRAKKAKGGELVLESEIIELEALEKLEALDIDEWQDGATLIHKDDFEEYVCDMLQEFGWLDFDNMHGVFEAIIDKGALADAHYNASNFTEVVLDGNTWYYKEY